LMLTIFPTRSLAVFFRTVTPQTWTA
jgi:hypothetical protein